MLSELFDMYRIHLPHADITQTSNDLLSIKCELSFKHNYKQIIPDLDMGQFFIISVIVLTSMSFTKQEQVEINKVNMSDVFYNLYWKGQPYCIFIMQ